VPPQVSAQPSEWFGTWTLSLEKSVYRPGPPPYKRATMKVEPLDGGRVRFSYDFTYPRGGDDVPGRTDAHDDDSKQQRQRSAHEHDRV